MSEVDGSESDDAPKCLSFGIVRQAWLDMQDNAGGQRSPTTDDEQAAALLATRELHLSWRGITDVGDCLEPFDQLQELYLQHNRLSCSIGRLLQPLRGLRLLMLSHNRLRDVDLVGLASLPLEALDLQSNQLENIESVLGCMPKEYLRHLWLRNNPCIGDLGDSKCPPCPPHIASALPELLSFEGRGLIEDEGKTPQSTSVSTASMGASEGAGVGESKTYDQLDSVDRESSVPSTSIPNSRAGAPGAKPDGSCASDDSGLGRAARDAAESFDARRLADEAYERRMRAVAEQHERTAKDLAGDVARRVHGIALTAVDRSKSRMEEMRISHDERMRSLQARLDRSLAAVRAPSVPQAAAQESLPKAAEGIVPRLDAGSTGGGNDLGASGGGLD